MRLYHNIIMISVALACSASTALAEDECSQVCPEGQVNVGFLDGQMGTCVCMPRGDGMQDVTPEVSVGDEGTDGQLTQ